MGINLKNILVNLLIQCDMQNTDMLSHATMSPSSSIEEIAEYISEYLNAESD